MQKKGKLFILIGPTAVGKNTLISAACEKLPELIRMPSATTRARRGGEIDGISKVFLTEQEFDSYIEQDQFIEWQVIHGHKYGVLKKIVEDRIMQGKDYAADVEVLGAMKLKECYGDDAVLIFVVPPSLEVLEKRIRLRGAETEDEIQLRLSRCKSELTFIPKCDYILMNDDLDQAVKDLTAIITAEREGTTQKSQIVKDISYTVIITDNQGQEILIDEPNLSFPQFSANSQKYPHQEIVELLASQNIAGEVMKDKSFQSKQNIGLEMPQPLWVSFKQENEKVLVNYIYVVKTQVFSSRFKPVLTEQLSKSNLQLPLDVDLLQKELHKYM